MLTMQDRAALAAFETIVARELVTREELKRWNVDVRLDSCRTFYSILFKNANNSRRIECEVISRLEPVADGGVKISVEITLITNGANARVPEDPWTDVLFNADKPSATNLLRSALQRRKRAACGDP